MSALAKVTEVEGVSLRKAKRQLLTNMKNNYFILTGLGSLSLAVLLLITLRSEWPASALATYGLDDRVAAALFAVICVTLAVSLIVYPILVYVKTGQSRRIEIIMGFYSPGLAAEYLDQFWSGRDGIKDVIEGYKNNEISGKRIVDNFSEILEADFGMGHYRFPLSILVAIASFVLFFAFTGGFALAVKRAELQLAYTFPVPLNLTVDLVSIAAIFGAYTWVALDAIARNHHGALHASDLSWYALRLLIAVPLGQAISIFAGTGINNGASSGTLGAGYAALLAFVISMFSLERISQIISGLTNRTFNIPAAAPEEREDLVIKLPGVDERTSNLLGAEGITTISQVISADPVRTSVRTSLPFDFVLSLIDTAILWKYVDGKLAKFREFGLTGASSILACDETLLRSKNIKEVVDACAKAKAGLTAANEAHETAQEALAVATRRRDDAHAAVNAAGANATSEQNAELDTAKAAYVTADDAARKAQAERDRAALALAEARSALADAVSEGDDNLTSTGINNLIKDLAAETNMKESGIINMFSDIRKNEYAHFICRLAR